MFVEELASFCIQKLFINLRFDCLCILCNEPYCYLYSRKVYMCQRSHKKNKLKDITQEMRSEYRNTH